MNQTLGQKIIAEAMSPVPDRAKRTTCQCGCVVVFRGSKLVHRKRCEAHK